MLAIGSSYRHTKQLQSYTLQYACTYRLCWSCMVRPTFMHDVTARDNVKDNVVVLLHHWICNNNQQQYTTVQVSKNQ